MKDIKNYSMDTVAVHAGIGEYEFGAVIPPIFQTSTFKFNCADQGARLFKGEEDGYIYTRMRNPTIEAMEKSIAALEGGAFALGCASGMAAIHTLFAVLLDSGSHVVCSESVYGPTTTLLNSYLAKFGVEATFVDTTKAENVLNAMKINTKLVFIETPGNPTLVMSDIAAIADIAHHAGAKLAVDNTFMSPVLQQPFKYGADYSVHSLTKFLNGHADVVGGVIVLKDAAEYPLFRKTLNHFGGVIDPFNSFLVHRGIKTLAIRMQKHCENAIEIANFLESHPLIEWVNFPGLKSHPQYEIGLKQMNGFGGMIAMELKGGVEAGKTLLDNLKLWQLAVSLGGVESLIQHPASMTHASMNADVRRQANITDGLVRVSVGIENAKDLIDDLKQALELITN
ncbi:MAG: PLP-dependent aspartate aminotransferase family protein [Candidatus Kapabacteria bacterium]|nr:PLP-dependent aspartate aminotransferase family protein [Candidatus Kapabacteria bacterium]